MSNIDFSISSSEDELEKTIEQPQQIPLMKKKEKNPAHVALSDKANDLRQALESILDKEGVEKVIELTKNRGGQASRAEIEKVVGSKQGAYHLSW